MHISIPPKSTLLPFYNPSLSPHIIILDSSMSLLWKWQNIWIRLHKRTKTGNFWMRQLDLSCDSGLGPRGRSYWEFMAGSGTLGRLSLKRESVMFHWYDGYSFFQAPWSMPLWHSSALGSHLCICTSFFPSEITLKLPQSGISISLILCILS